MSSDVVRVEEVAARMECSIGRAYRIIKDLNSELKKQGYITMAGRIPRSYLEKRCLFNMQET